MEQFDKMLKEMAEKEEIIVPKGFDGRLQGVLDGLPPETKKRGLGAAKIALIAVAACAALLCTAFAASPELRGMLAEALGGFAPYAQEQGGEPYVINGIEFRVKSVLADDFTVRAYVEARDLEGDRLGGEMAVWGSVQIPQEKSGSILGSATGAACLGYDETSKAALLVITSWGQVMADDLTGSEVRVFSLSSAPGAQAFWTNEEAEPIPVKIKPISSLTADAELTATFHAEEVRLSPLGLSVIFKDDMATWLQFAGTNVSVKLADGTLVEAPWEGGQGSFGEYGTESARKVLVWNFREPVEAEQIEGIYVGGAYYPVR